MCFQKSYKSNIFDGKRVSEAKNGETRKPKIHEVLNLLCFRYKYSSQEELKELNLCM